MNAHGHSPMKNPAPTEMSEILSPDWLTAALSTTYPGVAVTGVSVVEDIENSARKVRFEVTYAASTPANTPRAFCIKGFFGPNAPAFRAFGGGETEPFFYRDIARGLKMRIPRCVYTAVDPSNRQGIIIMEDLIANNGARFLTALSPYTSSQVQASLDQLARVHAAHWGGRGLDKFPWIESQMQKLVDSVIVSPERIDELMKDPRGAPLPAAIKSGTYIYRGLAALAQRLGRETQCLVHGDCHAGNVFEVADGPGMIDWQMVQRGCWSLDVAYHIGATLTTPERERSEKELVAHYLKRLAAHGAPAPAFDDAWRLYQMSVIYGYYLWAITQRVTPAITTEFVRRLGSAVASHNSFGLLGI